MLLGFLLKRLARLPGSWSQGISWLVFSVALPVMLFRLMSRVSGLPPVHERLPLA